MTVAEVSIEEYGALFGPHSPGYNLYTSAAFAELNRDKAEALRCLTFSDNKLRGGIILGLRDGVWRSPFSAPFGGFIFRKLPSVETVDSIVAALKAEAGAPVRISLPPPFYDPETQPLVESALTRMGRQEYRDLNYHYPLDRFARFEDYLDRCAKQKLRAALRQGFAIEFLDATVPEQLKRAYEVIKANHEHRRHPLRMTLQQVADTVPLAKTRIAVLTLDGADVAAAVIQVVTPEIAQVVYWGDAPGYSHLRPMNLLPRELFAEMSRQGFRILDIGPSSSDGIPDPGLCVFKTNLGCLPTPKPTFIL